ncbi:MAG: Asp-tRNA(Asn)/Glu-tRNA(Gln) amidotransferase subunit GatC [Magnetococcales bacterium]|nr:Asp-tRNA(Asn)/Glu-tRNA(Gln) amidotransferase subunit GatC [Magnetococcales bacterium]
MSIPIETVRHVAALARLHVDEATLPALTEQLSNILNLVNQLNELDTQDVVPMSHAVDMPTPERPDIVVNTQRKEALLANAPDVAQGHFQVPKIIE